MFNLESAFDNQSITIFIVGYGIVFLALVLLFFVFTYLTKFLNYYNKRKLVKQGKLKSTEEPVEDVSGEVNAAISMALYMFFNEAHDEESYISTIKKVSKTYSPWSSKIYGVRNQFNRL